MILRARKTNRRATVVALLLALFMAAMEMTVVSTAMPTVIADLSGAVHYAWVFSAYMLASTVTVPIYGKLADLHGRKPVLLAAIGLFLLGSMASGQARTMGQLIAYRTVQGIGAGGMQPIALTVVGDIYNVQERARMQGVFGAVWAIAGLIGPLLGGVIVATLSWRWVFYINVPFGVLSAVVLAGALVETSELEKEGKATKPLDLGGAFLLCAAVVALLLGTDGVAPFVLVPASIVLAIAFLAVEKRVAEPIVPLTLFRSPVVATTNGLMAATGGAFVGLVTFVPLYAQAVIGASPTEAGSTFALMAVTWPVASAISGRLIPKFGFRGLVRGGVIIVAIASAAFAIALSHEATTMQLRVLSAAFGLGMGFSNTALVIATQSSVGYAQRGVVTASTMFSRNIGGTLAVGAMGIALTRTLLAGAAGRSADGAELVARIMGPERARVDPAALQAVAGDLATGLGRIGWMITALSLIAVLTALRFPQITPPGPTAPSSDRN